MDIQRVGKRGVVFGFKEPITANVYAIVGDQYLFICDTYCGPKSMEPIEQYFQDEGQYGKQIVVFNSHADWDHIWGNCYFKDSTIIAHMKNWDRVQKEGEETLARLEHYKTGDVEIVPANLHFEKRIAFEGEGVEFFYSPGHTMDSASFYDSEDRILFVGDNIETPIPYVNNLEFKAYITTLDGYISRDCKHIVAGHDPVQSDDSLVRKNREYLIRFSEWDVDMESMEEHPRLHHMNNLSTIAEEVASSKVRESALEHYRTAENYLKKLEQNESVKKALSNLRKVTG